MPSRSANLTLCDIKIALISKIAHAIVEKKVVNIYLGDKQFLKKPKDEFGIRFVKNCENAQLVIARNIQSIKKACKKKFIFVTTYNAYKNSGFAIGALFWQKGRPELLFREKNLKKMHVDLPKSFKKYIDY